MATIFTNNYDKTIQSPRNVILSNKYETKQQKIMSLFKEGFDKTENKYEDDIINLIEPAKADETINVALLTSLPSLKVIKECVKKNPDCLRIKPLDKLKGTFRDKDFIPSNIGNIYPMMQKRKFVKKQYLRSGRNEKGGLTITEETYDIFDCRTFSQIALEKYEYFKQQANIMLETNKQQINKITALSSMTLVNSDSTSKRNNEIIFRIEIYRQKSKLYKEIYDFLKEEEDKLGLVSDSEPYKELLVSSVNKGTDESAKKINETVEKVIVYENQINEMKAQMEEMRNMLQMAMKNNIVSSSDDQSESDQRPRGRPKKENNLG